VGSSGFADADRADPPLSVDAGEGVAPGRDVLKNGTGSPTRPASLGGLTGARSRSREAPMETESIGPDIGKSALIIVDMQNDFLHRDGNFSHIAREHPEAQIDLPFLIGTIPNVKRLADAFRAAGRPVVYLAHVLKPDYSDAAFPYWRVGIEPGSGNRTHCVEGTWGAQIIDDLKPQEGEHLVVKRGFGGFSNTPLDTVLRNLGVTTCVVSGVTTCVCV
jgi:nicotinamidase-related amidase